MRNVICIGFLSFCLLLISCSKPDTSNLNARKIEKFTSQWKFHLGDVENGFETELKDSGWQMLDVPHDWSISESYSIDNPGGAGTKFMIGGIGWYRKSFFVSADDANKRFEITFDGVYQNSSVWINGQLLGTRPMGYITFKYDLTPYLLPGQDNLIAVKVDNSAQPNSRWYSGSGIFRNVWLTVTDKTFIDPWGFFVTTRAVSHDLAQMTISSLIRNNHDVSRNLEVVTAVYDTLGLKVAEVKTPLVVNSNLTSEISQELSVKTPALWSVDNPNLYVIKQAILEKGIVIDDYKTEMGIRYFYFDGKKGFFLNGESLKIKGVCMHHDLGALGSAINVRAMERQLEILKEMGCNGIRTSHNPPASELLQLCDRMGFIVMNETFDMWKRKKTEHDYSQFWDEWHERDLRNHIVRDRNHPSVIIWSIGNEILEQWHPEGTEMTKKLVEIVRELDSTRPITTGNNEPKPHNSLIQSGELDLIGYNYGHGNFDKFHEWHPGKVFIATETTSALATRGSYDMPSDTIRRWPFRWDQVFTGGNPDNSCSSYDNCSAPWGSTHEETWKLIKKHEYLSGMFVWTGFDYLGEPTPYVWPSRSSYFGIVDLAGFPKDAYYMYQSEWTDKTMLHVFPHWNWAPGQEVDIWAYYNNADEVELFLNNVSLGVKRKINDDLHVQWRIPFEAGKLKAITRKNGTEVLVKEISTAGEAEQLNASADRVNIKADGEDLSFITIDILDKDGNLVPQASNLVSIKVNGDATIVGVDNGSQISHEPFQSDKIRAFNGKCLVIIRSGNNPGKAEIILSSDGFADQVVNLQMIK
jgi:beta-galactosidase